MAGLDDIRPITGKKTRIVRSMPPKTTPTAIPAANAPGERLGGGGNGVLSATRNQREELPGEEDETGDACDLRQREIDRRHGRDAEELDDESIGTKQRAAGVEEPVFRQEPAALDVREQREARRRRKCEIELRRVAPGVVVVHGPRDGCNASVAASADEARNPPDGFAGGNRQCEEIAGGTRYAELALGPNDREPTAGNAALDCFSRKARCEELNDTGTREAAEQTRG